MVSREAQELRILMLIPELRGSSCAVRTILYLGLMQGAVLALSVLLERDHKVSNKKRLSQLI